MLFTLFRWEIRALRRDASFWIALTLALLAIAFALFNGSRWLARLDTVRASAAANDLRVRADARALAARLAATPDPALSSTRDPRSPYGYANYQMAHAAVLPATPLAALTAGQSDLLPSVLPLSPGASPSLSGATEPENPHRLLIGRFDATFAVIFLAPLLVIALTYALLAGERERGVLALLLAQPLTLRGFLAGRLAPRLLLCLGLLGLLGAGFFVSLGAHDSATLARLALWFALALAYGAFWFSLSLVVITRSGGSAAHALILAALWVLFVVLVPAGINLAAKTLHPVPSRIALILALRDASDQAASQRSQLLASYYEDHPEFAPKGEVAAATADFQLVRTITGETIERSLAPVLARYDESLARQQAVVNRLQYFSPALLAQSALAEAAGTGIARHRAFVAQSLAHHGELRAFFNPRILRSEKFSEWDAVPAFAFVEETSRSLARRAAPALAALLLLACALTAWALHSLRHYPITR